MKLSIKAKILTTIIFIISIAVIMWFFSFIAIKKASSITEAFSSTYVNVSDINARVEIESMNVRRLYNIYLIKRDEKSYKNVMNSINRNLQLLEETNKILNKPETKNLMPSSFELLAGYEESLKNYIKLTKNVIESKQDIIPIENDFLVRFQSVKKQFLDLSKYVSQLIIKSDNIDTIKQYEESNVAITNIINTMGEVISDSRVAINSNALSAVKNIEKSLIDIQKDMQYLLNKAINEKGKRSVQKYLDNYSKFFDIYKQILANYELREKYYHERWAHRDKYEAINQKLFNIIQSDMIKQSQVATDILHSGLYSTIVLIIILIVSSFVAILYSLSSIINPLKKFVSTTAELTSGAKDLTIRLNEGSKDELAELGKNINILYSLNNHEFLVLLNNK